MGFVLEESKRFDFPSGRPAFGGRRWENFPCGILTTKQISVVSVSFAKQNPCQKKLVDPLRMGESYGG